MIIFLTGYGIGGRRHVHAIPATTTERNARSLSALHMFPPSCRIKVNEETTATEGGEAVSGMIIIPFWMHDRLEEEKVGERLSFCPTCDRPVTFSIVRMRRKRMLYSVLKVSTKDLGTFLVCPICGGTYALTDENC